MEGEDFGKEVGNCCGALFSLIDEFLPVCDYYLHGRKRPNGQKRIAVEWQRLPERYAAGGESCLEGFFLRGETKWKYIKALPPSRE